MYGEIKKEELSACKEISLGEKIYDLLYDYGPQQQRDALNEAKQRHNEFNS